MYRLSGMTAALLFSLSAAAAVAEGHFERTFNVSGTLYLEAETDSGGIVVLSGPPGSVQIRATLKAQMGWLTPADVESRIRRIEQNPPLEQNGGTVRVGRMSDRAMLRGISMRLEITAPRDTKVRARTDSGGIRVEGIQGPVDLKADSGGIHAARIGSDIHAQVDSGGIRIRGVDGAVFAKTDSGGIEVLDAAGRVEATSDSGGIRVSQTKPAPIRAQTDSGGVHVGLAPGAGYDVDATASGGRVTVAPMSSQTTLTRSRAMGKIRGGGPLVNVKAESGPVTVE